MNWEPFLTILGRERNQAGFRQKLLGVGEQLSFRNYKQGIIRFQLISPRPAFFSKNNKANYFWLFLEKADWSLLSPTHTNVSHPQTWDTPVTATNAPLNRSHAARRKSALSTTDVRLGTAVFQTFTALKNFFNVWWTFLTHSLKTFPLRESPRNSSKFNPSMLG